MRNVFLASMFLSLAISACSPSGQFQQTTPAAESPFTSKAAGKLTVLYRFVTHAEGRHPLADVNSIAGVLYGTTTEGGTEKRICFCGVVFSIDASKNEQTLYKFKGDSKNDPSSSDGATPLGGLVAFNGTLYGTTSAGGDGNPSGPCTGQSPRLGCGTVYTIDANGDEHVIYRFQNNTDGDGPVGDLVAFHGKLYGVTQYGGGGSGSCYLTTCGTIYSISANGTEKVEHRFSPSTDGESPQVGLTVIDGKLYGTTSDGGGTIECGYCGTVYSFDANGQFKTIYAFTGKYDGGAPESTLVKVGGKIYGTTYSGGNRGLCGTIFSIDSKGRENTAWTFCNSRTDGAHPSGSLAVIDGIVYGTTEEGGANACEAGRGCGTIFGFNPQTGTEAPVVSPKSSDGRQPFGVTASDGVLYGAMYEGGGGGGRGGTNGTVYAVTP